MSWPKIGVFHHHSQLRLPEKSRAIKRLFVCYVGWLGHMIDGMGLDEDFLEYSETFGLAVYEIYLNMHTDIFQVLIYTYLCTILC